MSSDDLNSNNDVYLDFNNSKIDALLEDIASDESSTDTEEIPDMSLDATINDAITKLEKALNIVALSDDEMAEIYAVDEELHEDIDVLDFDDEF